MSTDPRIAARAAELREMYPNAIKEAPVSDYQKNLLRYAGAIGVAMLVGMLPVLIGQLSGDGDINWRPIIAAGLSAFLAALTSGGITSQFSRLGSEKIAAQVNDLRAVGVHRADMVVVEKGAT